MNTQVRSGNGFLHFLKHRRRALFGLLILSALLLGSVFAPVVSPYDPLEVEFGNARQLPSPEHPLGTDELGRDLLSRILYGGRTTLLVAVLALAVASVAGTIIGVSSGYAGGVWDNFLMRLIDVQLAFPGIIFAIAIIAVLEPGIPGLIIALSLYPIPAFARLSRATTLVIMGQDYVEAARAVGAGHRRIMSRHILPNIGGSLLVQASVSLPGLILIGSSLGFLGLGVQPPTPEWGAMLSRGRDYMTSSPHLGVFPGLAITLVVFGFTLLGDGLRDMLDPHVRKLEAN